MSDSKEVVRLFDNNLNLVEACQKAREIISQARELDRLYCRAVDCVGEGELQTGILELAAEAIQDEELREEVLANDESMLGFFCGVWIQYLLIEFGGIKKDRLRVLAEKLFEEMRGSQLLH